MESVLRANTHEKQRRLTEDQIVGILRRGAGGLAAKEPSRANGFSDATGYKRGAKIGSMHADKATRLRVTETEIATKENGG